VGGRFLPADEHRSDLQDMEIHVHLITPSWRTNRHRIDAQIHWNRFDLDPLTREVFVDYGLSFIGMCRDFVQS